MKENQNASYSNCRHMAKPAREYFSSLCILKLEDKQLYCIQLEISKVRKQNDQL